MNQPNVIDVFYQPKTDDFAVRKSGNTRLTRDHLTEDEAISVAKPMAKREDIIRITHKNGTTQIIDGSDAN